MKLRIYPIITSTTFLLPFVDTAFGGKTRVHNDLKITYKEKSYYCLIGIILLFIIIGFIIILYHQEVGVMIKDVSVDFNDNGLDINYREIHYPIYFDKKNICVYCVMRYIQLMAGRASRFVKHLERYDTPL